MRIKTPPRDRTLAPARRSLAEALIASLAEPALTALQRGSIAAVEWLADGSARSLLPGGGSSGHHEKPGADRFDAVIRAVTEWSDAASRRLQTSRRNRMAQRRRIGDLAIVTLIPTPDSTDFGVIRFERAHPPLPSLERLMREGMLDAQEATRATEAISLGTDVLVVGPIDSARHRLMEALIRYLPDDSLIVVDDLPGVIAIDTERRVVPRAANQEAMAGEYLPRLVWVSDGPFEAARAISERSWRPGAPQLILGYPAKSAAEAYRKLSEDSEMLPHVPRLALELRETEDGSVIDASLIEIAAPEGSTPAE